MIASGLRNSVDIALNREGELFTYDSDLEFDIGSPWYRPTRVNHVTSAAEFGWRAGSAKWPDYFADSNGSVVDIGPGSPTAISFGHHSSWPAPFQDKLFLCDWTFGTIYTVDLWEDGSSYRGGATEFLNGTPLNIAAMRFGPDGNMYFVVGGRNTDSKLYRIRYTGNEASGEGIRLTKQQPLRDLRHSLERYHGSNGGGKAAVAEAWPHLGHSDRSIRYAARVAIECQDLELWQEQVFSESKPRAAIHAAIALSRHGDSSLGNRLVAKLNSLPVSDLEYDDKLALLRAYSLCFIRMDPPHKETVDALLAAIDPLYPAESEELDTELCRLLCYLQSPTVVSKTIALMKSTQTKAMEYNQEMLKRHEYGKAILESMANTPNVQNIHYAYCLRQVQPGWSLEDRKYYFGWLGDTLKKSGGQSFAGYIRAIREDAITHLPDEDAAAVAWLLGDIETIDLASLPMPKGPAVQWSVDSAMELFQGELSGRDFENGQRMFEAGKCIACHRFRGSGGHSGPDLGSIANRYSVRDILVSIIEPSDSISEQYQASVVTKADGSETYGRVIYHNQTELALASNPFDFGMITKMPANEVAEVKPSQTSMMPPASINLMNSDELKDLIAYLLSGGDSKHKVFKK